MARATRFDRRRFLLGTAAAALGSGTATRVFAAAPELDGNPVTAAWTGPYGGVPPFDRITPDLMRSGHAAALAQRNAEIAAIAGDTAAPTFANTIEALSDSGEAYGRAGLFLSTYTNSVSDDAWSAVESELAPIQSAAADEVIQNRPLYDRIEAVWTSPEKARLDPEQQRLLWRTRDYFVRSGARVAGDQQTRLAEVNAELAGLYTAFSQRVLADENAWTVLEDEAALAGLPDDLRAALAAAATERELAGKHVVVNTRSSVDPFLTYSAVGPLRERVWRAFKGRGDNGDANDTNALIARIMPLRAEKARLLGFGTYADWKLGDKMAATPQRAMDLMLTVWRPAVAQVNADLDEMRALAPAGTKIEPWDYLYFAEKLRKAKFDVNQDELKPYFQLDRMVEAALWMAGRLYGFQFKAITGQVPTFHPDVRVWEVSEGSRFVGLFYLDNFARPGKRSGAWESPYRSQSRRLNARPVVSNNNNFVKGAPGQPVLISLDDCRTLFHEFGHALHDLLSDVTYVSLSGTNTATDFGETPSQIHENWVLTPEVLNRFALHVETGQPMPQSLVDKVNAASKFNQGYSTVETLSSAIVDMKMHMLADGRVDPAAFERETRAEIGAPDEIALRHRLPQFTHLFQDEGYAAGYYSYLWSDTMAADGWAAFEETGDPWNPAVAARLRAMMAAGDSVDQSELFRRFRGRDPDVNALLI